VCSIRNGKFISQLIHRQMIEMEGVSLCSLIRIRHMGFGLDLNNAGSRSMQAGPSPINGVETGIYREVKNAIKLTFDFRNYFNTVFIF